MPIAVIVEWYGPFIGFDALRCAVRSEWKKERTLYMALARGNKYQYIGRTKTPPDRINSNHKKLNHKDNEKFYIGQIVTQGITGPRNGGQPPDLKLAENTLIRALKPELNTRNKFTDPCDIVSIFSCFYDPKNYERATNPLPKFPKVLAYNPDTQQWLTEKGVRRNV